MQMVEKRALITGITGQDGSYLAEYLLNNDPLALGSAYEVAGLIRPNANGSLGNVEQLRIHPKLHIYRGDLADEASLERVIYDFDPDEIYNLGAEAAPFDSFHRPIYTSDINALGPLRLFEAVKRAKRRNREIKIYQASTSELYGAPTEVPQKENTPFKPNNPYGVAKLFAHEQARILRDGTDKLFISCGILFNHESPRRGLQYVTRKVTTGVACIKNRVKNVPLNELGNPILNSEGKLEMGNLDAARDWGYAPDYVRAMHLILQHPGPNDYVIATGETHTVKELLVTAFAYAGLDWQDHVVINPDFIRPLETGPLTGDYSKAKEFLGWEPTVKFEELIRIMVDADLARYS
jgi:GDPmannose 4,6-dehydratase